MRFGYLNRQDRNESNPRTLMARFAIHGRAILLPAHLIFIDVIGCSKIKQ
jgi:hypothetical protein